MITLIQLSSAFLFTYFNFDALKEMIRRQLTNHSDETEDQEDPFPKKNSENERLLRLSFLQAGLVALTIGAVLTVMMSYSGRMDLLTFFLIGVALAAGLTYALPPTNFGRSAFGELITTLILAILTPGLAFAFQTGELHRLLTLLAFPFSAMVLASLMALSLENYRIPATFREANLMSLIGWQKGMRVHDILIFAAYLLFGAVSFAGLPWALVWPALLSLPIGIFQVWQIRQISNGAKPNWRLLEWTAYGLTAVTAYLLSLALWTS